MRSFLQSTGLQSAPAAPATLADTPRAGPHDDILGFVPPERRREAIELIADSLSGNADAPGRLAYLFLQCAQDKAGSPGALVSALEIAERSELLDSGSLFLNLGHLLIERQLAEPAMRAYARASGFDPDHKWHAGQKVLEFILATEPDASTLAMIVAAIDTAPDFQVPDLIHSIIEQAVELGDFDLRRLQGIARALGWSRIADIGNRALAEGRHDIAMRAYDTAAAIETGECNLRQQMGVTQFLAGRYVEAEREWALTAYMRAATRERWGIAGRPVRFLGGSWLTAIGHVATIDTYIKSMELGWRPRLPTVCLLDQRNPPPGAALLHRWSRYIEVHSVSHDPLPLVQRMIGYAADAEEDPRFHSQRLEALTEEFWSGPDGAGRTRWYAPLGAEVERAWKVAGRGPLLEIGEEERRRTRKMLAQVLGLPEDAWFVGLHVREPGFHADWHRNHPGTRHADISTYDGVIDLVTKAGGWVVRLGDRSMKPIMPRPQVIDYATSPFRNFDLDVFLCGTCAYFIGTNSGLSLLPPLFGRRCVLTNWSPIAIPNWYLDDIYIPKLVRDLRQRRHLTFKEMYGSPAGWTQWRRDYPEGVQAIEDNAAEDLREAVEELHMEVICDRKPSPDDVALVARFNAIAVAGGSYVGSRIGTSFLRRHGHLL